MNNLEFGLEPLGQPIGNFPLRRVPRRGVNADEHRAVLDRYFPNDGAQKFLNGSIVNSFAMAPKADLRPQSIYDVAGKKGGALRITPPPLAFAREAIQDRATDHREADEDCAFNIVFWDWHAESSSVEVVSSRMSRSGRPRLVPDMFTSSLRVNAALSWICALRGRSE
ncbi:MULTISPECIES: hypothetical protein [Sinorhizobium]|uniref:hypothetical protein n=1 Tax=Sinorhizobium TaxID=28105 RepID=UPI0004B44D6E|nr:MULTISPECIES: hypothetical protein [Sinorhizobium]ASY56643.1 hypothetical protein SS05631_c17100 [Sinorhizobium sp. CCBAU 05631]AWM25118.1 hypothetical protein AOX55_00001864 [Sinorhizobium fredii CCBAU 25509]